MPATGLRSVGRYEILSPLGAGGMGEVYRARDSRLHREVAIKILPGTLAAHPELRDRFEREARAISSLNHPHICTLYDVGHQDGVDYLVMELIEGETLAARLEKGRLPIPDALRYAAEIADALDRAHSSGIIHRDLKPGNIMITRSGAKLLDFGLAKFQAEAASLEEGRSTFPTREEQLTKQGLIVGTVPYMAPEQLEGRSIDCRADIFSFGAVLYEMATGTRAFQGNSQASIIASILKDQPKSLSAEEPLAPVSLDRVVRLCLAKDPDNRWQSIRDVCLELQWIRECGTTLPIGQPGPSPAAPGRARALAAVRWLPWVLLALVGSLLAASLAYRSSPTPGAVLPRQPVVSMILPPPGTRLISSSLFAGPVVISPDGSRIAFSAQAGEGRQVLYVRPLDSPDAVPLKGTEDAQMPFWSPDGRWIGFFAEQKLKKIGAAGGPVFTLTDSTQARGATWNHQGVILFSEDAGGPLYRVSEDGGQATQVTSLRPGEYTHRFPWFLPDGRHFLYLVKTSLAGRGGQPGIYAGSLDSRETRLVVSMASNAVYSSGYLLYVKEGVLVAQPFDLQKMSLSGQPIPIADDVRMDERFSRGVFSASTNGTLVYQTGGEAEVLSELAWFDRAGNRLETVGESAEYFGVDTPELSPDGKFASASIIDPATGLSNVWLINLANGTRSRLSGGGRDSFTGIWSPDGKWIVSNVARSPGRWDLVLKSTSTGSEQIVSPSDDQFFPDSWSPDGRLILFRPRHKSPGKTGPVDDLYYLDLGERKPKPFIASGAMEMLGQFSPDGRLVAYVSNESGRQEVNVASFPDGMIRRQISRDGGTEPRWRRDGSELFYFDPDNRLMAAQVSMEGQTFQVGAIQSLFQSRLMGMSWRYAVSTDGKRFLINCALPEKANPALVLIQNWPEFAAQKE